MSAAPQSPARVLLLGGTQEARRLAAALSDDARFSVITSLAGRTHRPEPISGTSRSGGFGGVKGLEAFLRHESIAVIVDATHPFATKISPNAARAARAAAARYLRLCRAPWQARPDDQWQRVANLDEAAQSLQRGARVLLTIGSQHLAPFAARDDVGFIARMIEPPRTPAPSHIEIICARPPFSLENELGLMQRYAITTLVTKNAGGEAVRAKLDAARQLGISVVMVDRPAGQPPVDATTIDELMALLIPHDA